MTNQECRGSYEMSEPKPPESGDKSLFRTTIVMLVLGSIKEVRNQERG
jgi:hypothetical protein